METEYKRTKDSVLCCSLHQTAAPEIRANHVVPSVDGLYSYRGGKLNNNLQNMLREVPRKSSAAS